MNEHANMFSAKTIKLSPYTEYLPTSKILLIRVQSDLARKYARIFVLGHYMQPRSQALSLFFLPWSLQERPLVAAGHVTTQNLGGKKICWAGGWQSV